MNATLTWTGSVVASVAAHLGVALLILSMLDPEAIPDQPQPKSELRIETQEVAHSDAAPKAPDSPQATAASSKGSQLSEGLVPQSRAQASAPRQDRLAAARPATSSTKAAVAAAEKLTAASAPAPTKAASLPAAAVLTPASANPAQKLTAASAPAPTLAAALPTAAALKPASAAPAITEAVAATATALPEATDTALDLAAAAPATTAATEATPDLQPAAAAPADGDHMVAALAYTGTDAQIDPVSLKAIQSFMQPGDTAAQSDETHDALSAILTSAPCSRLQAEFNPETGSLDLRGHVPDPAMKGPILSALQAQLGTGIVVNDAMLILPRPQCGALSGIADVGLPQSQDQNTNPRLIGADAQARAYDYTTGQTLILDLAAPDYDAYVYVDYFAADGTVIHLVPNDTVPLRLRPAKSSMRVGAPDADEPFLNITIGPPYGQEIATAFAASAPLYDEARPLSEPAEPYLEFLKAQVTAARAKHPDFKGEWVYFFVSTKDGT